MSLKMKSRCCTISKVLRNSLYKSTEKQLLKKSYIHVYNQQTKENHFTRLTRTQVCMCVCVCERRHVCACVHTWNVCVCVCCLCVCYCGPWLGTPGAESTFLSVQNLQLSVSNVPSFFSFFSVFLLWQDWVSAASLVPLLPGIVFLISAFPHYITVFYAVLWDMMWTVS